MKIDQKSIKSSLFIMLFLIIATTFYRCSAPEEKFISLQLWSVNDAMQADPASTIEKIGKMGYKFVEAAGYSNGQFYGMDPVKFKALVEANGMQFLGSHGGLYLPDSATWDSTMAWWDECVAAHKVAGVKYMVQASMGRNAYRSLDTLKMYCDYFNAIGEKCKAAGIQFGYHNHAREFDTQLDGHTVYDFMLQNTDPEKVIFEIDLYWLKDGGGDLATYVAKYPGRFELYHVKDKAELGASGTMDFKQAFELAEKAGMKYYVIEVEEYNFDPLISVQKSIEFLKAQKYVK